jgi:hypothetical protein
MSGTLWHYTCAHARRDIGDRGTLLPVVALRPLYAARAAEAMPATAALFTMVWATDLEPPEAGPLGLTRWSIPCDRTEYRYEVPADAFTRWGHVRGRYAPELLDLLELAVGAEPARWWVSFEPVPAVYSGRGAP